MALFRRGLPRRAVVGAFVGFLYGSLILLLPAPLHVRLSGVGWGLLSISLLFARPFSYYAWVSWALLWVAWKGVEIFRGLVGAAGVVDVIVPLLALALVSSSGYLEAIRTTDATDKPDEGQG